MKRFIIKAIGSSNNGFVGVVASEIWAESSYEAETHFKLLNKNRGVEVEIFSTEEIKT